jgi:hypothetical protein
VMLRIEDASSLQICLSIRYDDCLAQDESSMNGEESLLAEARNLFSLLFFFSFSLFFLSSPFERDLFSFSSLSSLLLFFSSSFLLPTETVSLLFLFLYLLAFFLYICCLNRCR